MSSLLNETINKIRPLDLSRADDAANVFKSTVGNSLGRMSELYIRSRAILGENFTLHKGTIIACADHGVSKLQVSAYPRSTTLWMATNYLIHRGAAANALSNFTGSELVVADLGIDASPEELKIPGLKNFHIANGTEDITSGPAMTRDQAIKSLEAGILLAREMLDSGCNCLMPGEMGIGNTTSSAAIASVFCDIPPEKSTGRGSNISDERLKNKIEMVRKALEANNPDPNDGIDVLMKLGGFELGCIAGIILETAARHSILILDGLNNSTAALIAHALAPNCRDYMIPSQLSMEPSHKIIMKKLGLTPLLKLDLRLGEADGSALSADFLEFGDEVFSRLEDFLEDEEADEFYVDEMPVYSKAPDPKMFELYCNTMPDLKHEAMELCQHRIDNLAKPLHSLGKLEEISRRLAGITDSEFPCSIPAIQGRIPLLCLTDMKLDEVTAPATDIHIQQQLTWAAINHGDLAATIGQIRQDAPMEAFDYGRATGEELALASPVVCISRWKTEGLGENDTYLSNLLNQGNDGSTSDAHSNTPKLWPANEFIAHLPKSQQALAGATLGAIIGAAHNRSLIVLDDVYTSIIALYAQEICPDIADFLFNVSPDILEGDITAAGGLNAAYGVRLIHASLHVLQDMKTFAETGVPPANDGKGKTLQQS